jgi:hypothetical protein
MDHREEGSLVAVHRESRALLSGEDIYPLSMRRKSRLSSL